MVMCKMVNQESKIHYSIKHNALLLISAMFSPADQTVIAVATVDDRAIIYDIRNSKVFYISICYRFDIWGLAFLLT